MKKHKHLFKHTGGGCMTTCSCNNNDGCNICGGAEKKCDDSYECKCGAKIKVLSAPSVHFEMPQTLPTR